MERMDIAAVLEKRKLQLALKRLMDIVISGGALLVIWPVLLLIALAVLLVISLPLIKSRENNRTNYIQQIQKECKEAYNETNALSRTAGADSAAILSRVRSNIHAIRIINNLSNSEGNGLHRIPSESAGYRVPGYSPCS